MNPSGSHRVVMRLLLASLLVLFGASCQLAPATPSATTTPAPTVAASTAATPTPLATALPASSPTPVLTPTAVAAAPSVAPPADLSTAIRQVAQKVKPAVVQITNQQVQFDQFNQPFTIPAGVGSGVIYDRQGHILTNNHVIEGAEKLQVSLPDGRSFPGKLVGADPLTDLAVVQVSATDLPSAELGDSSKLEVGDWVVAIGNALGLPGGPTVTVGVVSALGRTIQEPGDAFGASGPFLFDVIQTSAPINPGNSGGPLVNLKGEVVGINTMIAGQAEPGVPAQGIGFAIAINTAKPVADQLVTVGRAVHPYLGIRYVPLSPTIAAQLGTTQRDGVVVGQVAVGSPAARAGLRRFDIITAIDGVPLQGDSALAQAVNKHKPGDTLTLKVIRGDQALEVRVTLGEMPSP